MALAKPNRKTAQLGELVAALYDRAARMTGDPERASRLAARAVTRLLVRTGNLRTARRLALVDDI
jgi:hypothetical protein